ncbi:MAG: DUF6446 family protein [Rhodobacteraceae bacterium]|jgi:hypothetical protein|nr:DUF6446 family protein [Paracoccaceae bacterium]
MNGRTVGIVLLACGAMAGAGMAYLQLFAFYDRPGAVPMTLTRIDGAVVDMPANGMDSIDSDSSPIRFRACFTSPLTVAQLADQYEPFPDPEPLIAPFWFSCFDAPLIAGLLESGAATAFLSERNIRLGVDRVVAVADDGRAWAWHQLNNCGRVAYDGSPVGEACPPRE